MQTDYSYTSNKCIQDMHNASLQISGFISCKFKVAEIYTCENYIYIYIYIYMLTRVW